MRFIAIVCSVLLLFGACGGDASQQDGPMTIEGVVIDVDSAGLNEVTSFDIRHEGEETRVYIDENHDYGFPLGHLSEHLSTGDPVIVTGEVRDGRLYAESIVDA